MTRTSILIYLYRNICTHTRAVLVEAQPLVGDLGMGRRRRENGDEEQVEKQPLPPPAGLSCPRRGHVVVVEHVVFVVVGSADRPRITARETTGEEGTRRRAATRYCKHCCCCWPVQLRLRSLDWQPPNRLAHCARVCCAGG